MDEPKPADDDYRAFVGWLQGKLYDLVGDREEVFQRVEAQMARSYAEGIDDALLVARRLAQAVPGSREVAILVDALAEMREKAT